MEEKGGFIWVFYGSKSLPAEERLPIPYVPELGGWRCPPCNAVKLHLPPAQLPA